MTAIIFAGTVIVVPLLLNEFYAWCPRIADRLVRWSASRLPGDAARARYLEEYRANLAQVPGNLAQLAAALSYALNIVAMRRTLRGGRLRPVDVRPPQLPPGPLGRRTSVTDWLAAAAVRAREGRVGDVRMEIAGAAYAAGGRLNNDDSVLASTLVGTAYVNNGKFTDARRELDLIKPWVSEAGVVRQARFWVMDSHLNHVTGDDGRAVEGLLATLALLDGSQEPTDELAVTLGNCCVSLAVLRLFALAARTGSRAIETAVAAGANPALCRLQTALAHVAWGIWHVHFRRYDEARSRLRAGVDLLRLSLQAPEQLGSFCVALAYSYLALAQSRLGEPEQSLRLVYLGRDIPTASSSVSACMSFHAEGAALVSAGRYAEALEPLKQAWDFTRSGLRLALSDDLAFLLGQAAAGLGDYISARTWFEEADRRRGHPVPFDLLPA